MKPANKILIQRHLLGALKEYEKDQLIQALLYELVEHDKQAKDLIQGKTTDTNTHNADLNRF